MPSSYFLSDRRQLVINNFEEWDSDANHHDYWYKQNNGEVCILFIDIISSDEFLYKQN